jgi:FMN phosphatase YigB (HAD superfamily)
MLRRAHDDDLVVAFDADDTLWHNEPLFNAVQQRFTALLAPYCSAEEIDRRLYDVEIRYPRNNRGRVASSAVVGYTLPRSA